MKSYHDTTTESKDQLDLFSNVKPKKEREKSANRQEVRILNYLKIYSSKSFTPEDLHNELFGSSEVPLTSVRRALSNLTKQGEIIKSETADRMGNYGHPVHTWRAA